jgi:hypothetical protein
MRRLSAVLLLLAAVLWPAAAMAATPKASLELLVLLPQKHTLAVFEQVEMAPVAPEPSIGLLQGFQHLSPINVSVIAVSHDAARISGSPTTIAVKYSVPWDGTSTLLMQTLPVFTGSVVVMVPQSLTLPPVLNPNWTVSKSRKIPGLPNSPTFRVYTTSNVQAGQSVAASVESSSSAPTTSLPASGFPLAGRAVEFGLGLAVLAGALVAVNWRPLTDWAPLPDVRDNFLGRLASLESEKRRGVIADEEYQTERAALLTRLEQVWRKRPQ